MPGAANSSAISSCDARFDVPVRPDGENSMPSMGHSKPSERPLAFRIGNRETRVPFPRARRILGGARKQTSSSVTISAR